MEKIYIVANANQVNLTVAGGVDIAHWNSDIDMIALPTPEKFSNAGEFETTLKH